MERINVKAICGLAAVFLVLCAYAFFIEPARKPWREKDIYLCEYRDAARVAEIQIQYPGSGLLRLKKTPEGWRADPPSKAGVSDRMVGEMLQTLQNSRIAEIVDKEPRDLAAFGLSPEKALSVEITSEDGRKEAIAVGSPVALNSLYVYAKRSDTPAVYRIWQGVRRSLAQLAEALRGQGLSSISAEAVQKIEMRRTDMTLTLERVEDRWLVVQPERFDADPESVRFLIETLRTLLTRIQGATDAKPAEAAADSAVIQISIWPSATAHPVRIRLQPSVQKGQRGLLASTNLTIGSVWIEAGLLKALPESPEDLRTPWLSDFSPEKVDRIRIVHPKGMMELLRDNDGNWKMVHPQAEAADPDAVGRLLHILQDFRQPAEPRDSAEKEEGPRDIQIDLWESGRHHHLSISEHPGARSKLTPGVTVPLTSRSDTVERLLEISPATIADRHLLRLTPRRIDRIRLKWPNAEVVCKKKGNRWYIQHPDQGLADGARVWQIIFALNDAKYRETGQAAGVGCQAEFPQLEITLWNDDDSPAVTVRFSDSGRPGQVLAVTDRPSGCYLLGAELLDQFPQNSAEISPRP